MPDVDGDEDMQARLAGLRGQLAGDLQAFLSEHHGELQRQFSDWMAKESAAFEQAARATGPPHAAPVTPKAPQPGCLPSGPLERPRASVQVGAAVPVTAQKRWAPDRDSAGSEGGLSAGAGSRWEPNVVAARRCVFDSGAAFRGSSGGDSSRFDDLGCSTPVRGEAAERERVLRFEPNVPVRGGLQGRERPPASRESGILGTVRNFWGSLSRTRSSSSDVGCPTGAWKDPRDRPSQSSTYSRHMNRSRIKAIRAGYAAKSKLWATGAIEEEEEEPFCNLRAWGSDILQSPYCNYFFSAVIVTYIITMGIEVEDISDETRSTVVQIQTACDILFVLEVVLRMLVMGREFLRGQEWHWNLWDLILALVSVWERVYREVTDGGNSSLDTVLMLRIVRITRVIRIMRVTRLFRFFRSFRLLITSICATMKSLVYAVLLLGMIMYSFGIVFTQCAREENRSEAMSKHFGTMMRSVSTLFQSVTSGLSWEVCFHALSATHWLYGLLFGLYILFALFCVMNVITAQFCQNAIESSKNDDEEAISDQMADRSIYVDKLEKLFASIAADEDGHCVITLEAFEENMKNERVVAFFRSLDIKVSDAWTLFKLLDDNTNNCIDMDKFIQGCLQLKGPATAIHVQELASQFRWFTKHVDKHFSVLEDCQAVMERNLVLLTEKSKGGKVESEGELA